MVCALKEINRSCDLKKKNNRALRESLPGKRWSSGTYRMRSRLCRKGAVDSHPYGTCKDSKVGRGLVNSRS